MYGGEQPLRVGDPRSTAQRVFEEMMTGAEVQFGVNTSAYHGAGPHASKMARAKQGSMNAFDPKCLSSIGYV